MKLILRSALSVSSSWRMPRGRARCSSLSLSSLSEVIAITSWSIVVSVLTSVAPYECVTHV